MDGSKTHQELIRDLYRAQKARSPKFSLSYLCARAGIPSKGYLGDVIKGKRRLSSRYAAPLGKAFGLGGLHLKLFVAVASRDVERDPALRARFEREIASLERRLKIRRVPVNTPVDLRLMSKVFSASALASGRVTAAKIAAALPSLTRPEIARALAQLEAAGALERVADGEFVRTESQIMFPSANEPRVLNQFFRASLGEAAEAVPVWFKKSEQSYFESSVLSVSKKAFLEKLPEIKEFFDRIQSDLDTDSGDGLVYFNIQVYPQA